MTDTSIWNQPIPVPEEVIAYVDDAVRLLLPPENKIIGISPSGSSYWARTAKIQTQTPNGESDAYFIKVQLGDYGRKVFTGELASMRALYAVTPELVPRPVDMGQYQTKHHHQQAAASSSSSSSATTTTTTTTTTDTDTTDTWFFLCEFKDMHPITATYKPDPSHFTSLIAHLHHRSVAPTPSLNNNDDGTFFGFPVPTYGGRLPMLHPVCDTWRDLFTRVLTTAWEAEEATQGVDEEMRVLRGRMMDKVVPRLLRPLEEEEDDDDEGEGEGEGEKTRTAMTTKKKKKLVPRLVHADLWHGNVGVDVQTGRPIIFDAVATYAHNEYELAAWRPVRHHISQEYIHEYVKHFPKSEPVEDFWDRNLLYCIKFNLHSSALYPGNLDFRNLVREEIRELVDKYPDGYEGYVKARRGSQGHT